MADNRTVFVGVGFLLLSGKKIYSIAHSYEIVGRERLTDSLTSSARRQPVARG